MSAFRNRPVSGRAQALLLGLAEWLALGLSLTTVGAAGHARPTQLAPPAVVAATPAADPANGAHTADVEALAWQAVADGAGTFLVQLAGGPPLAGADVAHIPAATHSRSVAPTASLAALLDDLQQEGHLQAVEVFGHAGWLAVVGDEAALRALRQVPAVLAIRANHSHRLGGAVRPPAGGLPPIASWNLAAVGAVRAWERLAASGEGSIVATIDTGADWRHPALADQYRGRGGQHAYNWFDAVDQEAGARAPIDPHGHGTAVLGLILGRDAASTYGVAPRAQWLAVRAFDASGVASDVTLLRAAEWLLAPTDEHGHRPRPDLAPHVVNCSWTLENPADPLFERVVAAWHAAGIVPVFAVGNSVSAPAPPGSALAPATYSSTLAVGASTPEGSPWVYSRRGPGWFGGTVPDLLAPGVAVRSTAPGGGEQVLDGTSMASAQVAGAACLLLSARRDLTVEEVRALLCHTARDIAPAGPDPESGCGLLDVHEAALAALRAGRLSGLVRDGSDRPLAGARLLAWPSGEAGTSAGLLARPSGEAGTSARLLAWPSGEAGTGAGLLARPSGEAATRASPLARPSGDDATVAWSTTSDAKGRYSLVLPAGMWRLSLESPPLPYWRRTVGIAAGQTTLLDWRVSPAQSGVVVGHVAAADGRAPIGAQVRAENWPASTWTAADGRYRLELPAGRHVLSFQADGCRSLTTTVRVSSGLEVRADATLWPAPRVLVVDADAWRQERVFRYLTRALDDLGYPHDVATVDHVADWDLGQLASYDVVIWLHPYTSPGELDRQRGHPAVTRALAAFVSAGGRLLLSGQEVGRRDAPSPGGNTAAAAFYRDILGARRVGPAWGVRRAMGLGLLDGLHLDLADPFGHPKGDLFLPDVIEPAVADGRAVPVLRYADGGVGGLAVDDGTGRRLFLAFGLESAGSRVALATLLDWVLAWLEPAQLRLTAGDPTLTLGESRPLQLQVLGGRSAMRSELRLSLASLLQLVGDGPSGEPADDHVLWSGTLAPQERLALRPQVRLRGGVAGGSALPITATLLAAGHVQTATLRLTARTPDLRPSRLAVEPPRLDRGGMVTVTLRIANSGPADAADAVASIVLAADMRAVTTSLACSAGACSWQGTGQVVEWCGAVAAGETVEVKFRGLLPPGIGQQHAFQAMVTDRQAGRVERWARVLVGGPKLVAWPLEPWEATVAAGAPMTLGMRIANLGPLPAQVRAALDVPPAFTPVNVPSTTYDDACQSLLWRGEVPAGGQSELAFVLVPGAAARGDHAFLVRLVDGFAPEVPVECVWQRRVQAPDLASSRLLLLGARLVSGGTASVNLVLRNAGDLTAPVAVRLPMLPAMVIDPTTVRASEGQITLGPAHLDWSPTLPPSAAGYRWQAAAGGDGLGVVGSPVTGGGIDLGFGFPFGTEVYTRTYLSPTGLLTFASSDGPAPTEGKLEEWRVPAIAAHYRPDDPRPMRVDRSDGLFRVTWDTGTAAVRAVLERDGVFRIEYGPGVTVSGVTVGLTDGQGQSLTVPLGGWRPGGGVIFHPPDGIAWLAFEARLGHGWPPNGDLTQSAQVKAPGEARELMAKAVVDRVSLSASRLVVEPAHALAGAKSWGQLEIIVHGDAAARDLEARIDLPAGLNLVPDAVAADVAVDSIHHTLTWRGTGGPGASHVVRWQGVVVESVLPGAQLVTRASLQANGVAPLERGALQTIQASDFSGSRKVAWRSVAAPGEVVSFSLRVANAGRQPVLARVSDALPDGLEFIPGALLATVSPAPRWDERSRSLSWQGAVPPQSAVEIELGTRFRATQAVTNVMRIEDEMGTAAASWAEVRPLAGRLYLPLVAGRAREP